MSQFFTVTCDKNLTIRLPFSMGKSCKKNAKFPNKMIPQFIMHAILYKMLYTFKTCVQEEIISDYYLLECYAM
jgi:hypothetical protein